MITLNGVYCIWIKLTVFYAGKLKTMQVLWRYFEGFIVESPESIYSKQLQSLRKFHHIKNLQRGLMIFLLGAVNTKFSINTYVIILKWNSEESIELSTLPPPILNPAISLSALRDGMKKEKGELFKCEKWVNNGGYGANERGLPPRYYSNSKAFFFEHETYIFNTQVGEEGSTFRAPMSWKEITAMLRNNWNFSDFFRFFFTVMIEEKVLDRVSCK